MIQRRRVRLALLALAALPATGCATFSDNDAVARVGDIELSNDQFQELTGAEVRADGDLARAVVTNWIRERVGETTGIDLSDVVCLYVVQTPDVGLAESTIADYAVSGLGWTEFVATIAPEIPEGGRLPCVLASTAGFPPEIIEQLADLDPTGVPKVVQSAGGGVFIVRSYPPDEFDAEAIAEAVRGTDEAKADAFVAESGSVDVYVDARVGTYVPAAFVVVPVD